MVSLLVLYKNKHEQNYASSGHPLIPFLPHAAVVFPPGLCCLCHCNAKSSLLSGSGDARLCRCPNLLAPASIISHPDLAPASIISHPDLAAPLSPPLPPSIATTLNTPAHRRFSMNGGGSDKDTLICNCCIGVT
jgi:hypothetical protein